MPITSESVPESNLTIMTLSGEVDYKERLDAFKSFYENPTEKLIYDKRSLNGGSLTVEDVRNLVEFVRQKDNATKRRMTAVVSSTTAEYGLSRMFELIAKAKNIPWEIKCFNSYEEAEKWISQCGSNQ